MREKFSLGQRVMLSGKPKYEGLVWQMHHPRVEVLDEEEEEPVTKILPVYPLTEGLQQWQMRKIIRGVLETCADKLDEVFPEEYLRSHDLWPLRQALPQVHFPSDMASLDHARRRLVYQELFILQLALALRRQQQHDQRRRRRWRPRPRSTPASAACSPSSSPRDKNRPSPKSPPTWPAHGR